jgi:hypothetical protein
MTSVKTWTSLPLPLQRQPVNRMRDS